MKSVIPTHKFKLGEQVRIKFPSNFGGVSTGKIIDVITASNGNVDFYRIDTHSRLLYEREILKIWSVS